jgi:hypothetical protein
MSATETYAARVDAVIEQRARLRGAPPPGDPFPGYPLNHPLMIVDGRRALEPNLAIIASYVQPDDVLVDVGGGAGRLSLPLALRCREVIVVEPSADMLAAYENNAQKAGITNVRSVNANWESAEPPRGTLALVSHVTYLTRDIVPFLEKLEQAASRRVIITVGNPQPPSWNRDIFPLIYGEPEAIVPGHVDLVNVLWEMGVDPDVRVLPDTPVSHPAAADREAAIQAAFGRIAGEQWARWPLSPELEGRIRGMLESRFDELFTRTEAGYTPVWITPGHEVLITWESRQTRSSPT